MRLIPAGVIATVRRADRIAILDGGRITERGGHEELLAAGGQYAAGAKVSLHVNALDTLAGRRLSYSANGLPQGLAINGSGTVTDRVGGPARTYQVTIRAKNTAGSVGSVRFTWRVTAA